MTAEPLTEHPFARVRRLAVRCARLNVDPTARAVLQALTAHENAHGRAWPSQDALAWETGLDRRTVRAALERLEAVGLVSREGRKGFMGWNGRGFMYVVSVTLHDPPARAPKFATRRREHLQTVPPRTAVDGAPDAPSAGTENMGHGVPPKGQGLESEIPPSPQTPHPENRSQGDVSPRTPARSARTRTLAPLGGSDESGGRAPRAPAPVGRLALRVARDRVDAVPDSEPEAIRAGSSNTLADALAEASRGSCAVMLGARAARTLENLEVDVDAMRTLGRWLLPADVGGGDGANGLRMGVPSLAWMLGDGGTRLLQRIERARAWQRFELQRAAARRHVPRAPRPVSIDANAAAAARASLPPDLCERLERLSKMAAA